MRILAAGDAALLIELGALEHALALYRNLVAEPIDGVHELVPAATTLLVHFRPEMIAASALAAIVRERWAATLAAERELATLVPDRVVEIPVYYNGEDLPEVAELLGISVAEVIRRHTGQPWQAAFAGFAPGFVYLSGGHPSFQIPRRASPRTRVPAGSVALAGDFSAVYPAASPGGWQLIGVTGVPMWDLQRSEPSFVQPGFRVQFVDAGASALHVSLPSPPPPEQAADESEAGSAVIEFEHTGLQTLVQDAGRHGLARLGVSPSGALDQGAMREANRLVGNPVHAAVLENLLGGLRVRCRGQATLAVTGAEVVLTLENGRGQQWTLPSHAALALDDGDCLSISAPSAGVRSYVAVRGGWGFEAVLGSCATDTLSHIGPAAIQAGQRVAVGSAVAAHELRAVAAASEGRARLPRAGESVTLDVIAGPRADWFTAEALALLESQEWQVTPQSNRIGMRLEGAQVLTRCHGEELPSEGTVTGSIQVPSGGQPVLFLADHPVTGGYPVIAVVASRHLGLAAQIPVGCTVRFKLGAPCAGFASIAHPSEEPCDD